MRPTPWQSSPARTVVAALALFALMTAAQSPSDPTKITSRDNPNGAMLHFGLFMTARSPMLRFIEATDWFEIGDPNRKDWTALVDGRPIDTSQPMIGTSLRIEGSLGDTTDNGYFRYNPSENATVHPPIRRPFGPILVDDALDSSAFTGRRPSIYRNPLISGLGNMEIANVTVQTAMNTSATHLLAVPTYFAPFVTDANERDTAFEYQRSWVVSTEVPGPGGTARKHRSLIGTGSAQLRVRVPRGTSFLVVNGTAGPKNGALALGWENEIVPNWLLGTPTFAPSNSSRPYISTHELLYYTPLDQTMDLDTNGTPFSIKSAAEFPGRRGDDITSPTPTGGGGGGGGDTASSQAPSSVAGARSKPNVGAIVCGVIAGVVALVLAALAFVLLRRRRRNARHRTTSSYDDDDSRSKYVGRSPNSAPFVPLEVIHDVNSSESSNRGQGHAGEPQIRGTGTGRGIGDRQEALGLVPRLPEGHGTLTSPYSVPLSTLVSSREPPLSPLQQVTKLPLLRPLNQAPNAHGGPHGDKPPSLPSATLWATEPSGPLSRRPTHEEDAGQILPPRYNPAWDQRHG